MTSEVTSPRPGMSVGHRIATLLAVVIAVTATSCGGGSEPAVAEVEQPTFSYVIPVGSGDLVAQGESLEILPAVMDTKIGETIQIVNDDTVGHVLGPWFVGPGETIRQRFVTPGTFSGFCSVHPEESFTVNVADA